MILQKADDITYRDIITMQLRIHPHQHKADREPLCNHLYFHTPSEPPLFKGDSRDVKNKK